MWIWALLVNEWKSSRKQDTKLRDMNMKLEIIKEAKFHKGCIQIFRTIDTTRKAIDAMCKCITISTRYNSSTQENWHLKRRGRKFFNASTWNAEKELLPFWCLMLHINNEKVTIILIQCQGTIISRQQLRVTYGTSYQHKIA